MVEKNFLWATPQPRHFSSVGSATDLEVPFQLFLPLPLHEPSGASEYPSADFLVSVKEKQLKRAASPNDQTVLVSFFKMNYGDVKSSKEKADDTIAEDNAPVSHLRQNAVLFKRSETMMKWLYTWDG